MSFQVKICINNLHLNSLTCSIFILSILMVSICTFLFAFWNVIYLDFAMFNNYNLFILSHSFIKMFFYLLKILNCHCVCYR